MTELRVPRPVGRPPLTDRRALLTAARAIGFPKLTVGAVTEAVGVKYSTFYRHYPSLEALIADLVDDVCADADLPEPTGPWQTYLTDTCCGLFRLLDDNPGLAETIVRLPVLTASVLTLFREMSGVLLDAGFDPEQSALGAVSTLELVAITWLTTPGVERTIDGYQDQLADGPNPVQETIREAARSLIEQPAWPWAARKVALLIKGLEAELAAGSPAIARPIG